MLFSGAGTYCLLKKNSQEHENEKLSPFSKTFLHQLVSTQVMGTSGYQVFDLEDIQFHWEDAVLNMNTVFRPGVDTPFFPSSSTVLRGGQLLETLF